MVKIFGRFSVIIVSIFIFLQFGFIDNNSGSVLKSTVANTEVTNEFSGSYYAMHLDDAGLSKTAFDNAMKGYAVLHDQRKINNDSVISIIDFSLPSVAKRLFVIDIKNNQLLFNTLVSHGRNSGVVNAEHFSNSPQSFESSLGFYVTADTYIGKHGYSLRLQGEEDGINDNAFNRGIVMHCAKYVSEAVAKQQGYIGRSEGCPALPENMYKPIIEKIKNGSCLFIYSPDKFYTAHSKILQASTNA